MRARGVGPSMLDQRTSINLLVPKRETQLPAARTALVIASNDRVVTAGLLHSSDQSPHRCRGLLGPPASSRSWREAGKDAACPRPCALLQSNLSETALERVMNSKH